MPIYQIFENNQPENACFHCSQFLIKEQYHWIHNAPTESTEYYIQIDLIDSPQIYLQQERTLHKISNLIKLNTIKLQISTIIW